MSAFSRTAAAAVLLAGLAMCGHPAYAQDCFKLEDVKAYYEAGGLAVTILDDAMLKGAEKLSGIDADRGIIITDGVTWVLGLEVKGCLLDPIYMTEPLQPAVFYGDRTV